MKIIVSSAVSVDGYTDDLAPPSLALSSTEDWEAVRRLRSQFDAIMVGANTIRRDNPSLITTDTQLINERRARGENVDPIKVTVTATGDLPIDSNFFQKGSGEKIVYVPSTLPPEMKARLARVATVRKFPTATVTAREIVSDLESRGVRSLFVEGGATTLTMFFLENLANEFRLAIAPFFVGEEGAPRFVRPGLFPFDKNSKMKLENVENLGGIAVLHYTL